MSLDKNRLTLCRAGTVVMTRFTNHSIFWVSLQGKVMKYKIQRNQLTLSVVADNLIEGGDPMGSFWQQGSGTGRGNPRPICHRIVIRFRRKLIVSFFDN